jgi:hypothetical protein
MCIKILLGAQGHIYAYMRIIHTYIHTINLYFKFLGELLELSRKQVMLFNERFFHFVDTRQFNSGYLFI